MWLKIKIMFTISSLMGLIFSLFFISCKDTINQPVETAFLDSVISSLDSVRVEYDDEIIVNRKLSYSGILGYSAHIRMEKTEVGIHKIKFIDYDDASEVSRIFYVEDTMQIIISNYPSGKVVQFRTINHEHYGE
jgi:hypothetical protein